MPVGGKVKAVRCCVCGVLIDGDPDANPRNVSHTYCVGCFEEQFPETAARVMTCESEVLCDPA